MWRSYVSIKSINGIDMCDVFKYPSKMTKKCTSLELCSIKGTK